MTIGERITALRTEKEISQGQLAAALGVSRQAVSKWETDKSSPDTIRLIELADLLETEVEYLATGRKPVYQAPPIEVNLVQAPPLSPAPAKIVTKYVTKYRTIVKYRRILREYVLLASACLLIGFLIGFFI